MEMFDLLAQRARMMPNAPAVEDLTDGDYYIVDRWKDMYISGGENVYPAKIEQVLRCRACSKSSRPCLATRLGKYKNRSCAMPSVPDPSVPDSASIEETRSFSQEDFDLFARLSGDGNPIHVDPVFAAATRFGGTVAHGMLLFSAIRGLMARHFPDRLLLSQNLMFPAPTYADEMIVLRLQPVESFDSDELRLLTTVIKADSSIGLRGECVLRRK